jgi:hypothetical protein
MYNPQPLINFLELAYCQTLCLPDFCQTLEGELPLRAALNVSTWTQSAVICLFMAKMRGRKSLCYRL